MKRPIATILFAALVGFILSACENSTGPETVLPPLEKWSFSGQSSTYQTGIAVRGRGLDGKLTSGITVWLTDQAIDCSAKAEGLPSMQGGWIGIKYPEISLGKNRVRLLVGYWSNRPEANGNIDVTATAKLSGADTSGANSVSGSLEHHESAWDKGSPFGATDIKGRFTVPYCPDI